MKKILKFLGLSIPKLKDTGFRYPNYKYKKRISKIHLTYLKELLDFHRDRQSTIENKTSQLVGQSSVVFSLVALFIPLFFDKFIEYNLWIKIVLTSLLLTAFIFYLYTIIHSTRTLSINKYKYATGDANTVFEKDKLKSEFVEEEINDLLYSINLNSHSNDQKGTNLIYAHRTFSIGNIVFGLLAFFVCLLLMLPYGKESVQRNHLSSTEELISAYQKMQDELSQLRSRVKLDSLQIQMIKKTDATRDSLVQGD